MLVTFSCQAYANVTLFGDIGQQLLKIMGYGEKTSGIISAEAVSEVLERLTNAVETDSETSNPASTENNADVSFSDEPVSLANRALPLIELLKAASEEKCNVWWETT